MTSATTAASIAAMQPYGYPAPPPAQKSNVGIILLIVGLVVGLLLVLVGVFAVLGIYGTRRYIAAAKSAEAINSVHVIAVDAQTAYETESIDPTPLTLGAAPSVQHKLCKSASQPVPASIAYVRGKKYMSSPEEWDADEGVNGGFYCLKFSMMEPQYYQYDYSTIGDGSHAGDSFTATAMGDLDDDGKPSSFKLVGTVSGGNVTLGELRQTDPDE